MLPPALPAGGRSRAGSSTAGGPGQASAWAGAQPSQGLAARQQHHLQQAAQAISAAASAAAAFQASGLPPQQGNTCEGGEGLPGSSAAAAQQEPGVLQPQSLPAARLVQLREVRGSNIQLTEVSPCGCVCAGWSASASRAAASKLQQGTDGSFAVTSMGGCTSKKFTPAVCLTIGICSGSKDEKVSDELLLQAQLRARAARLKPVEPAAADQQAQVKHADGLVAALQQGLAKMAVHSIASDNTGGTTAHGEEPTEFTI